MKRVIIIALSVILFCSCSHRIADLTMISTRNVEMDKKYIEKERSVKGRDVAMNDFLLIPLPSAPDIEDAIDNAVKKIEGGEYMTNVVIREKYLQFILFGVRTFVVEGDVWAKESNSPVPTSDK